MAHLAKGIGLDGVRLHDLRHAYATKVAASGAGLAATQRLLGHSSAAFTASVYTHPNEDEFARAADAVARASGRRRFAVRLQTAPGRIAFRGRFRVFVLVSRVRPPGLEPGTCGLRVRRSDQLS